VGRRDDEFTAGIILCLVATTSIARSRHSFDLTVDGRPAGYLSYSVEDGSLLIEYVEVDHALRGKGMGEKLVDAAVAWANEQGHKVVPLCSFAKAVLRRRT
jgi:predicted GNAT family acetyltransferase